MAGISDRTVERYAATGPNQVWSWDIMYLPTIVRGRYLFLYVVIDVWSRRVVGWTIHERDCADHAAALSRPHVSNDNPYSESMFRTLRYTPAYPSLPLASAETARARVSQFVA
jgi:putative transposase